MQDFHEWLTTEAKTNDIVFSSFWKYEGFGEGGVIVYIRGKKYEYTMDALYIDKLERWSKFAPGKVLNRIKDMVRTGHAKQVEPPPVQKTQKLQQKTVRQPNGPVRDPNSCPNCGTPPPHYILGIECPGCGLNTSEHEEN